MLKLVSAMPAASGNQLASRHASHAPMEGLRHAEHAMACQQPQESRQVVHMEHRLAAAAIVVLAYTHTHGSLLAWHSKRRTLRLRPCVRAAAGQSGG